MLLPFYVEPCAAFQQLHRHKPKAKLISPLSLQASSEDWPDMGEYATSSRSIDEDRKSDTEFLFDRSHLLVTQQSTDSMSSHASPISSLDTNSALIIEAEEVEEELRYLNDIPVKDSGSTCFISESSSIYDDDDSNWAVSSSFDASLPFNTRNPPATVDLILRYLPFIMPVYAYYTYEDTAKIFNRMVEIISNNNWVAVDGGQYQSQIITPAINGLVVPSIALLFATLMSNTINTLRQRQLQIRSSLNTEANDMRMLSTMVDSLPSDLRGVKNHLREYLIQYASRIVAESRPGLSIDLQVFIGSMDSEINGFLGVWNKLSISSYATLYVDTMLPATKPNYSVSQSHFDPYQNQFGITSRQRQTITPFVSPQIFAEVYDALTRLRNERSTRLSALQSTYPALHYVILSLLGGSICVVFLMETNQELLIFLSAIQLRILWSMLVGTFSSLAVVNYDMRDPFSGSYNVDVSVDQFYMIRESIRATIQMDQ